MLKNPHMKTNNKNMENDNALLLISTAVDLHQRGDYDSAEQAYVLVLSADPDHFDALHYLGVLYYQTKQPERALPLLKRAASVKPKDAACQSNLGLVLLALGQTSKAIDSFHAALRLQPDFADAFINLGNAFMSTGQIEKAVSAYRSALALNGKQPSVHNNLGVAFKRQGLLEEAIKEYLAALKLSPTFADAGVNLGDALVMLKRYQDAARCYQQASRLNPEDQQLWVRLGDVYKTLEQWNEAKQAYQRALELNDKLAAAVFGLGVLAQQLNDLGEAYACYLRAIHIDPNHAQAYNNLGTILYEQNELTDASKAFQNALLISPQFAEARYNLAKVMQKQGNLTQALSEYMTMIKRDSKDGRGYYGAVKMLDLLERYDEIAKLVEKWQSSGADIQLDAHLQAALTGKKPVRASNAYIIDQFDELAEEFDSKLAELQYRAPQLIADEVVPVLKSSKSKLRILDAGCGTGLCGALLRPYAEQLVGVDLSPGMLEKAGDKNIYDNLVQAEITEFFRKNRVRYDIIVSADTLVYFGALTAVLKEMCDALNDEGILVFTVEKLDEAKGYKLQHTGRYAHTLGYLTGQLKRAGFLSPKIREVILRTERFRPVAGWLIVASPDRKFYSTNPDN